jgi:hypothetical protein
VPRRESSDGRGIDAATQENTDRNVRHQPAFHGDVETRAQLFAPSLLGTGGNLTEGLKHEVPIFLDPQSQRLDLEEERMAAGQLIDALENRMRRGNVAIGKIFFEGPPR